MLTRQSSQGDDIDEFRDATRLFYSNEEVANFNYEHLIKLNQPIAKIYATHSTNKAKTLSSQEMYGL